MLCITGCVLYELIAVIGYSAAVARHLNLHGIELIGMSVLVTRGAGRKWIGRRTDSAVKILR